MLKTLSSEFWKSVKNVQQIKEDHPPYFRDYKPEFIKSHISCCGITEFDFSFLTEYIENHPPKKPWSLKNIIAYYINNYHCIYDKRVVLIGIPIDVGEDSMYNLDLYEEVYKILKSWGFTELTKPYVNENSGNTLTVMAVQWVPNAQNADEEYFW